MKIDHEKIERARKIREFKKNPPKLEVGMEENSWAAWINAKKENDAQRKEAEAMAQSQAMSQGFGGNTQEDSLQTMGNGLPGYTQQQPQVSYGTYNQQQQAQPEQTGGTNAEKYAIAVLKEIGLTIKGVFNSFKGNDVEFASRYGRSLMISGLSVVGVAGFFLILSFFFNWKRPIPLISGGIILTAGGLFIQTLVYNKTSEQEPDEEIDEVEDIAESLLSNDESEEEENLVDALLEKEEPVIKPLSVPTYTPAPARLTFEAATRDLDRLNPDMYTRQFLYERYEGFLPRKNPDFNKMKALSDSSDEFLHMDTLLREACKFVGIKEENIPLIDKLEENAFVLRLYCKRKGLTKTKDIANEIANAYRFDNNGIVIHEGAYATTTEFGNTLIITLFKGTSTMITLGDIFPKVKDFLLDTHNMIPIILGVDELGQPIYTDFKKMDSVIISGLPRTGKSLFMQSIVAQLCMFMSPKEVQFHIMDLKDGVSDFQGIETGHIKSFSTTTEKCINTIRYIVKELGTERKRFLQSYGFKNILDFKKKHPDIEFPFIYLVVDEMMNLADSMDKEEKAEFQGLLSSLISMMPALGVRVILIPHRIVNDVIAKNSYTLVPCRINVMGKGEELEKAMGVSANSFPYHLTKEGNAAVVLKGFRNGEPFFCHGSLLTADTESEDIKEIFSLIDTIWGKVKIEESKDSFEEEVESQEK